MRTVSPQKKFPSLNPDYVFGSNTAGNFTPPYTGYYYMRAVGGGGSASLRSVENECVGGGAGGGYDGEIFLEGGKAIPYSVGMGGTAATMDNWGNNGTETRFGSIVLGGGYGGNITIHGGRGGNAGICKGGLSYIHGIRQSEEPKSFENLFGGGGGLTPFYNDSSSHFDLLANGCGKHVRTRSFVDIHNNPPHNYRSGGCSVFGVGVDVHGIFVHGRGGDVYGGQNITYNAGDGRIEIWRLQ